MERNTPPKIRFGIAPGSSARIAEQQARSAEPSPSLRIQGGTAARKAEAEAPRDPQRPYGVSMQARTGRQVSLADLMEAEAEAYARRLPGQRSESAEPAQAARHDHGPTARAQDGVRISSFRPLPTQPQFSASAGDVPPIQASSAGTKEETPTAPRSPFQLLRSLFSRNTGPGKNES